MRHVRSIETLAAESVTLQAYLREIAKFPRLSHEEERNLGRRIRDLGESDALRQLLEANLRFVVSYATRYRNLGVPLLDLIHEGNLGLIEAARRFDPERDGKFITCAVWWIRQGIMHLLSHATRNEVGAPPASAGPSASRQAAALQAQLEHAPIADGCADHLEIADADVQAMMEMPGEAISVTDRKISTAGGDGVELTAAITDAAMQEIEDEVTRDALVRDLESAMTELNPKERQVMRLRYGLHGGEPWTLQQIGERLLLSRERVRQIESRATQKLRRRKSLRSYLN